MNIVATTRRATALRFVVNTGQRQGLSTMEAVGHALASDSSFSLVEQLQKSLSVLLRRYLPFNSR